MGIRSAGVSNETRDFASSVASFVGVTIYAVRNNQHAWFSDKEMPRSGISASGLH